MQKYNSEKLYEIVIEKLEKRGVKLEDIAEIAMLLQKDYNPDLTIEECLENVKAVIKKEKPFMPY